MKLPRPGWGILLCLIAVPVLAQKPKTAAVQTFDGAPTLLINGQPELPFMYALTHVSGGRWSWEELPAHNLRNACADGIRLYQVDLWLEDLWPDPEKRLNMDLARRQIGGVLEACPGAAVVVRLHVNAPMWWNHAHPEECVQFADGPVAPFSEGLPFNHEDGDIYRSVRASLASERWRTEAGARVAEFCRRLRHTREGRAVIGIHLSGGVYGEWHPWGFFKHEPDVSPPMQAAFRRWLETQYRNAENLRHAWNDPTVSLASATIPDTTARRCCADGYFRDPAQEQRVIDFYKCQQDVIADDIEFFCRTVKENWKRPLITGVFYGYFHFSLCRQAMAGHLEIHRLLNSRWIDYFAGPTSYNKPSRIAGGSGLQRSIVPSVLRHGKLWFDEIDNGHLQNKRERDFVRSDALGDSVYLPVFQRSLWLPLIQGCGLWLYDFGPRRNTGWWDGAMYRAEIRRTREYFARRLGQKPAPPVADALVVWDTESFYYVENTNSKTCERGLDDAAEDLQRCGVALDHTYLFDLQHLDLDRYQAVIFMNAWKLSTEQRSLIQETVARKGRTVIWNYLPGYTNGRESGKNLVEDLTGILLEQKPAPDSVHWEMDDFAFKNPERVNPLLVPADTAAVPLGFLVNGDSSRPVIVRKKLRAYTSVYAGVPLHGSAAFQKLFREAGCQVWNETGDFTFPAGNKILVHRKEKGTTTIHLKTGMTVTLEMAGPGTVLLEEDKPAME